MTNRDKFINELRSKYSNNLTSNGATSQRDEFINSLKSKYQPTQEKVSQPSSSSIGNLTQEEKLNNAIDLYLNKNSAKEPNYKEVTLPDGKKVQVDLNNTPKQYIQAYNPETTITPTKRNILEAIADNFALGYKNNKVSKLDSKRIFSKNGELSDKDEEKYNNYLDEINKINQKWETSYVPEHIKHYDGSIGDALADALYDFTPLVDVGNEAIKGASRQIGQMTEMQTNPGAIGLNLAGAGAGAGAGFLAGNSTGIGALLPEEIVSVPAGAIYGLKKAMTGNAGIGTFQVESGSVYKDMVDSGVDTNTAKAISTAVGAINAGLEMWEVDTILNGMLGIKGASQVATTATGEEAKKVAKKEAIKNVAKLYLANILKENVQESAQETVSFFGENAGKMLQGLPTDTWGDYGKRIGETIRDTTLANSILSLPGLPGAYKKSRNATFNSIQNLNNIANRMGEENSTNYAQSGYNILNRNSALENLANELSAESQNKTLSNQTQQNVSTEVENQAIMSNMKNVNDNFNKVERLSNNYGQNGAKQLINDYKSEQSPDTYELAFRNVYFAGRYGNQTLNEVLQNKVVTDELDSETIQKAYQSGINDLKLEQQTANRNLNIENTGLVENEYTRMLNPKVKRQLNTLSKMAGIPIELYSDKNTNKNGSFEGNKIRINVNGDKPLLYTAGHEIGHQLKLTDRKAYTEFQNAVVKNMFENNPEGMDEAFIQLKDRYDEEMGKVNRGELSYDEVMEEMTGDAIGYIIDNEEAINRLTQTSKGKQFLQQIRDMLMDFINKFKRVFGKGYSEYKYDSSNGYMSNLLDPTQLEDAIAKLDKALKSTQEKLGTKSETSNETRYQISEDNQGNKLSKEQQEFFKDSKIVDENGNLKVMYHGTKSDFTVFKESTSGEFGPGIYLADTQEGASFYSNFVAKGEGTPKEMEVYTNIKNPYIINKLDYMKKTERIGAGKFRDKLIKQGYDGIIGIGINGIDRQYVVFNSNQIKNIDNTTPTENEDIRYSLSEETNEKINNLINKAKQNNNYITVKELSTLDKNDILETYEYLEENNITVGNYKTKEEYDRNIKQMINNEEKRIQNENTKYSLSESTKERQRLSSEFNTLFMGARISRDYDIKINTFVNTIYEAMNIKMHNIQRENTSHNMAEFQKQAEIMARTDAFREKYKSKEAKKIADRKIKASGLSESEYYMERAEKFFGTTNRSNTAGYILPNGKMLDFSGSKYLREIEKVTGQKLGIELPNKRLLDHSAIIAIYDYVKDIPRFAIDNRTDIEAKVEFMQQGAIRVVPEGSGLKIKTEITKEQIARIKKMFEDYLNGEYGNNRANYFTVEVRIDDEVAKKISRTYGIEATEKAFIFSDRYTPVEVEDALNKFFDNYNYLKNEIDKKDKHEEAIKKSREEKERAQKHLEESGILNFLDENSYARYSLSENIQVEKPKKELTPEQKIAKLEKQVKKLKQQTQLTKGLVKDDKAIRGYAKELIETNGSEASQTEIYNKLKELYSMQSEVLKGQTSNEQLLNISNKSSEIVDEILSKSYLSNGEEEVYSDVAKRLRNTPIKVSEELRNSISDYNDFRKQNFGKLRLKNDEGMEVDSVYQELSQDYPWLFPEDIWNAEDRLYVISEFVNNKPKRTTVTDMTDYERIREDLSAEIFNSYNDMKSIETYADKIKTYYEEKLDKTKLLQQWINALDKKSMQDKMELQKKQYQEKIKEIKYTDKERQDMKLLEQRIKQAERIKSVYDKKFIQVEKQKIQRNVKELDTMLRKPTITKHIPQELRTSVADFLANIDFTTDKQKANKVMQIKALRQIYQDIAQTGEFGANSDITTQILTLAEDLEGKRVVDMNREEIQLLSTLVKNVKHIVSNTNKVFIDGKYQDTSVKAKELLNDLARKVTNTDNKFVSSFKNTFEFGELKPITFFRKLGNSFVSNIYNDLRQGQNKNVDNITKIQDYLKNVVPSDMKEEIGNAKPTTYQLSNGTIDLTKQQLMSLYLLNKRQQAQGHIYGLGIIQGTTKYKEGLKEIINNEKDIALKVTEEDVDSLLSNLSDKEKKVADDISTFLNTTAKDFINEASMKLYGFEIANEEDYFPIQTKKSFFDDSFDTYTADPTITSWSALKQTKENSATPIVINNIFDVVSSHLSKSSVYNSFAVPMDNIKRLMNYRDTNGNRIVESEMNRAYGKGAYDYLKKLMADLQGGVKYEGGVEFLDTVVKNTKVAKLGLNLRVSAQQFSAYPRALAVLDESDMIKALAKNTRSWEEILDKSQTARWKEWGYYNADVGRSMENLIFDKHDLTDLYFYSPQKADSMTWHRLYSATEYNIRKNYPNVEVGSDEYFKLVNDKFDEVIDRTQVIDTTLNRSQNMRKKDTTWKITTAFRSEPTVSENLILDSYYQYQNAKTPSEKKKALNTVRKNVEGYAGGLILSVLIQATYDSLKKPQDDDEDKFLNKILENATSEMAGQVYFGKEIYNFTQGYSSSNLQYGAIEKLFKTGTKVVEHTGNIIEGKESSYTNIGLLKDIITSVSEVAGLPTGNVIKGVENSVNNIANATKNTYVEYEGLKLTKNIKYESNRKYFYDKLFKAYMNGTKSGDMEEAIKIYNDMLANGFKEDSINNSITSRLTKKVQLEPEMEKLVDEYSKNGQTEKFTTLVQDLTSKGYSIETIEKGYLKYTKQEAEAKIYTPKEIYKEFKKGNIEKANEMYESSIEAGSDVDSINKALELLQNNK